MDDSSGLVQVLTIWMVAAVATVIMRRRAAGLVIAYLVNLWLLHWLAMALLLIPGESTSDPGVVQEGFLQSTYAVIGFAIGAAGLASFLGPKVLSFAGHGEHRVPDPRLPARYVAVGLVAYLLVMPALGQTPTLTAILSAMWNLAVVGFGLGCLHAWRTGRRRALLLWAAGAASLPFLTILFAGFLGFGAWALLAVLTLLASAIRWRPRAIIAGLLLAYLGMSFYVTYMRDRNEIRAVVWGGEDLAARAGQLYRTVSTTEWFDPWEPAHRLRIEDRLNQNLLVGKAASRFESRAQDFAAGETLWQALIAFIPRALWPEKPVVAGSMGLVSAYTGTVFARGTSVGMGQVFEFYINFGTLGVFLGFVILGTMIGVVDMVAAARLARGDWQVFALWYLPGLALLQVGGSLVEVTASAGAAILAAILVNRLFLPELSGVRHPAKAPVGRVRPRAGRVSSSR